jgi:hypothetical protein
LKVVEPGYVDDYLLPVDLIDVHDDVHGKYSARLGSR